MNVYVVIKEVLDYGFNELSCLVASESKDVALKVMNDDYLICQFDEDFEEPLEERSDDSIEVYEQYDANLHRILWKICEVQLF